MLRIALLAIVALVTTLLLVFSALDIPAKISPQGCRMSYMSPSYVLQTGFNSSWTSESLASRYRLMLYREVGWDSDKLHGNPVLFIPGNAGSAHQVRSIASSSTRQYYLSPYKINPVYSSRDLKPLDVFAVDFNEDLSAFHGPTLASQRQYTSDAIGYILSLYPSGTKIIVMGHSMGGIVGSTLLPASEIKALITMSTPHSVPPARFDARMDTIYSNVQRIVESDATPILSICGGITDTMIPSEFCVLPPSSFKNPELRKTIFTSSLEGCWSGVGHREMVWCHQVRWRVARVALELGGTHTVEDQKRIFNNWFRDGLQSDIFPPTTISDNQRHTLSAPDLVPVNSPLIVRKIQQGTQVYNFALPKGKENKPRHFLMFLSKGTMLSVSPFRSISSDASVHLCHRENENPDIQSCFNLPPSSVRLIPNPDNNAPFPVPRSGVDESDGVVVYEAPIPFSKHPLPTEFLSVSVSSRNAEGWFIASLGDKVFSIDHASTLGLIFGTIRFNLGDGALQSDIFLPNLLSNVLLVYRATAKLSGSCEDPLLSPMLLHTSSLVEAHFYRLQNDHASFLHGHQSAPFLPLARESSTGLNISIFTSGECSVRELELTIDWWNSFGRWGPRYWNAVLSWSVGIISFMFFTATGMWDKGLPMVTPFQLLRSVLQLLPKAMLGFTLFSFLPIPSDYWLGNGGEPLFALIAPFILVLSVGLVALSWILLTMIIYPYSRFLSIFSRQEDELSRNASLSPKGALITISIMGSLVFLLIPWQVAFLSCYLIHWHHCAALICKNYNTPEQQDSRTQKMLVLFMMTWCLPVVAPVLAVWVRTLLTAGLTTPFDGDHFLLNSLSFVMLTYVMVTHQGTVFSRRHRIEIIPVPYLYLLGSIIVFLLGPRATYRMYEALNWPTLALLAFRVVPHVFRNTSSSTATYNTNSKVLDDESPIELDERTS